MIDENDITYDQSEPSEATQIVDSNALKRVRQGIASSQQAYVIVIAGPHTGRMFKLEQNEIVLGRSPKVEMQLQDVGISRTHARLYQVGNSVFVEDLQSANGTFLNGQQLVMSQQLQDGDKITLGSSTILKFTYHDKLDEDYQKQMVEAAIRDGLTKAYNKKYFSNHIMSEYSYAKRHNTHIALVLFDVDHFKHVNDTYGHLAGDYVLVELARLSQQTVRAEDMFARYGGEEFVVVARGLTMYQAYQFAERLRLAVQNKRFVHQGVEIPITISLGVASYPEVPIDTHESLIAASDAALYTAKNNGRNRAEMAH